MCVGQVSKSAIKAVVCRYHAHHQPHHTDDWRLQACTFKVDYVLENVPGREFGSVFLSGTNENLALQVVSSGWSKVYIALSLPGPAWSSSTAFAGQRYTQTQPDLIAIPAAQ